jgi:exosome complex component RRP40
VLSCLGQSIPFEIAIGVNGSVWVHSGSPQHTILVINAILNSEIMTDDQTASMVKHIQGTL